MEKEKENVRRKRKIWLMTLLWNFLQTFFILFLNRSFVAEKLFPIANSKHYKVFSFLVECCWMLLDVVLCI